ncbi:MAG: DUF2135 domain-containing protein [Candidatus Micrarchaeota archaeon]
MEFNSAAAIILAVLLVSGCGLSDLLGGGGGAAVSQLTDRNGAVTANGGTTTQRVQTVSGTVMNPAGAGADTFGGDVFIVHNGNEQQVTPAPCSECGPGEWGFTGDLVLDSGSNNIMVVVRDAGGNTVYSSPSFNVNADIPPRDITVTLTWATDDNDVDLHIYDPQGNHAWYSDLDGIPGGNLDLDDTDGFGPETFTMEQAAPGPYTVKVRYYSAHGVTAPVPVTVRVSLNEGPWQTYTQTFTADQANGDDPSNDWTVTTFTVQ